MGIDPFSAQQMLARLDRVKERQAALPTESEEREVGRGGLVEKCLSYADAQWPPWVHWGARTDVKSTLPVGCHDQTFALPNGRFLLVEFKAKSGKRTKEQQIWAKRMEMVGTTVHECRSLEQFLELAKEAMK